MYGIYGNSKAMDKEMLEKISAYKKLREGYYAKEKIRRDAISRFKYAEEKEWKKKKQK